MEVVPGPLLLKPCVRSAATRRSGSSESTESTLCGSGPTPPHGSIVVVVVGSGVVVVVVLSAWVAVDSV
jgi:hypothetical protein